jgi:hypothetical protein
MDFAPVQNPTNTAGNQAQAQPANNGQASNELVPNFMDKRCKVPFKDKTATKRAAKWNRLNSFHKRSVDTGEYIFNTIYRSLRIYCRISTNIY